MQGAPKRAAPSREASSRAAAPEVRTRFDRRDQVAAIVALVAGIAIAFLDSRPGWDDTGITAVCLAVAAAFAAAIAGRRPWLWAIASGIWVPLVEVRSLEIGGPFLSFSFAGVGAAVGWLMVQGDRGRAK